MASESDTNPTTLELTESESKLRDLLLGVANYIDDSPTTDENATEVHVPDELTKEKIVLRWTGGWVRDKLLGVGSHDIDVAINKMTGEHFGLKMLEYLKSPGNAEKHALETGESKKIMTGLHTIKANPEASKNLETATIKIMGIDLDLVNLRKETYNEVSRNPQMEFGTAEEDAMRRDATVNAMFYNLNSKEIEDFTGRGFEDMAAKIIRTPLEPYQTFVDDPLRVLRLIRFASRLNYTIEPDTANAMGNAEIQKVLKIKIKRERVGIELEKMLNGPDPHMALALIHKFGLYETIFTDPTRDFSHEPEMDYFKPAYDFVNSVQNKTDQSLSVIFQTLLRTHDEKYLAWVCAAVMPWVEAPKVPNSKPSRPPFHAAYLVAQEGFKAPNRVCDVIAASLNNGEEIMNLVQQCHKHFKLSSTQRGPDDATARDTLGMAIRRWGSSWRLQVFFSLVHEIVLGSVSKPQILRQYTDFLNHLTHLELLDADTFKPLVNGKELASAMNIKPGPWMKDALEVVMAWQLRNPNVTDPAEAIEEVKKTRKSELPSRLISQFLSLTIPPLFAQTSSKKLWKDPKAEYFLDLLRWSLHKSEGQDIRNNMKWLRPPIMALLQDDDLRWRAKACELVTLLTEAAPAGFMAQHGYREMFTQELFQFFHLLPSLTPEEESITLLAQTYPALEALCVGTGKEEEMLDRLVREGVLAPLSHFPVPSTYPALAALMVTQLSTLFKKLGVNSVKHLQSSLPLLGSILQDRLAPAYPQLPNAAAKCLQSVIETSWPRISGPRAMEMYLWVSKAWLACHEYTTDLSGLEDELKEAVVRLDALLADNEQWKNTWLDEKKRVLSEDSPLKALFERCTSR